MEGPEPMEEAPAVPPKGPAERALAGLKSFSRMAWETCREPLACATCSPQARWEIYSTWTLLLCQYHAEAEAERCRRTWTPQPWRTEAQALRHIFLSSRSIRSLAGVLRWLRFAHCYGPGGAGALRRAGAEALEDASYERTRRALQMQEALPTPFQAPPALHPDGPLQQRDRFHQDDLEDEQRLLAQLWICLRHGNLQGALKLCADGGQAWRTALLQGMMPFADGLAEEVGYDAVEDEEEDHMAQMKEEHTDWTELGVLERHAASDGNPWRRVWKEQCCDTAQRNLRSGSCMELHELAVYGFCSGQLDAMLPACGTSWTDRCWAELHCLKECLVERLLELGRAEWCRDSGLVLGEGDAGVPDPGECAEDRAERSRKLCGRLREVPAEELEAFVGAEVRRIVARLRPDLTAAASPFSELQVALVEAAWSPEKSEAALAIVRRWVAQDFEGAPCPFLVKEFASYFAIWQKEVLVGKRSASEDVAMGSATVEAARAPPNVDDIIAEHVQDLVAEASGSWHKQCLEGEAIELIAKHIAALAPENRLDSFFRLLLTLGIRESEGGHFNALRVEVLERCMAVYWSCFPHEAFMMITVFIRRALHLDDETASEEVLPDIGATGVHGAASSTDITVAVICVTVFWDALRATVEADGNVAVEGFLGLETVLGRPLGIETPRTSDDVARIALDLVVLPLLTDALFSLCVKDPGEAMMVLPVVKESLLWRDVASSHSAGKSRLDELEWYVGLCNRHRAWALAHAELQEHGESVGLPLKALTYNKDAIKAEQQRSRARDALLDWARPCLARDRPWLEPRPGMHTSLADGQWEELRRAGSCRALLLLLAVFEGEQDFDGAMHDLSVAAAQSPWLLKLLRPQQVRAFMRRLSLIPMTFGSAQGAAVLGG
uniref:Nuclear pore complex protein n=1 Tax=Alexandrium catenella TaxID=2925 RepID=A0A7S1LR03_ALECA